MVWQEECLKNFGKISIAIRRRAADPIERYGNDIIVVLYYLVPQEDIKYARVRSSYIWQRRRPSANSCKDRRFHAGRFRCTVVTIVHLLSAAAGVRAELPVRASNADAGTPTTRPKVTRRRGSPRLNRKWLEEP